MVKYMVVSPNCWFLGWASLIDRLQKFMLLKCDGTLADSASDSKYRLVVCLVWNVALHSRFQVFQQSLPMSYLR